MSIKQFGTFFAVWIFSCVFVFEPAFIAPLFETVSTISLAFSGDSFLLGGVQSDAHSNHAVESLDHFRVLCVFYFGVPIAVYLAMQAKEI